MQFLRQQRILLSVEAEIRTESRNLSAAGTTSQRRELPDPDSDLGIRIAAWEWRVRTALADVQFAHLIHQRHAKRAHLPAQASPQRRRAVGIEQDLIDISALAERIERAIGELLDIFAYGGGREGAFRKTLAEILGRQDTMKTEWAETLADLRKRRARVEASVTALSGRQGGPGGTLSAFSAVATAIEGLRILIQRAWNRRRTATLRAA
ncbi:hypothetical protein [Acidimangrovimonas sediminis]|uniref:hypothetical protein n=1 Tax=Acidimangrovimonas sediminis TaxID=2056283 RepID=UPI000C80C796|nr:hypothetical protein [Acidimangrovimonas sediminis]